MIPIEDIRVGNLVMLYGSIATVQRSDFSETEHGIAIDSGLPIEIDKDWLLDADFIYNETLNTFHIGNFIIVDFKYLGDSRACDFGLVINLKHVPILYVHQLQNLYYDLQGAKLNFKNKNR